jgi:hypothetical protein
VTSQRDLQPPPLRTAHRVARLTHGPGIVPEPPVERP